MSIEDAHARHQKAIADMLEAASAFHGGDMHRAADRARCFLLALCRAVVEELKHEAFMCHSIVRMPTPDDLEPPHVWKCPGCAVEAIMARLDALASKEG